MTITKICENCGKEFTVKKRPHNKRFCSHKCWHIKNSFNKSEARRKEMIGKKFGRLTVIDGYYVDVPKPTENRVSKCLYLACECDCGEKTSVLSTLLLNGKTRSCGCLVSDTNKKYHSGEETAMMYLYKDYASSAKRRGLEFSLSPDEFISIIKQPCFYCGCEHSNHKIVKNKKDKSIIGEFDYNGIDRFDNKKGYVLDNVVPCCCDCNQIKMDFTYDYMISKCKAIISKHESRKELEVIA